MNIIDIISKKRQKEELTKEELNYAFVGYLNKKVQDYQMSALLMAICINDMTDNEVFDLTEIFIQSGEILDLSEVQGMKVDKHSTGGVGDKTTLVVAPLVAACGVNVAKMSGRGLGHTGGTIDKLESIPGFNTGVNRADFIKELQEIKMVVASPNANLVPLDKEIYALRDVTATTESIPLIAVSIMSKKIASGADKIVIDVKIGKGALIKNREDAIRLSNLMMRIGAKYNKEVKCLVTDMNNPLGRCIGNSLEVAEAVEILMGNVNNGLSELCIELASNMISLGKNIPLEKAKAEATEAINNKSAYNKFLQFVKYQGGDLEKMYVSTNVLEVKSDKKGIVTATDALALGELAVRLGAGRKEMFDAIDYGAGIVLNKVVGDKVDVGDVLFQIYANDKYILDFTIEEIYTIE